MTDLFRDTLAGQVIRIASGNRLLSHQENEGSATAKNVNIGDTDGLRPEDHLQQVNSQFEAEKGSDFELVSWDGPHDPAVCISTITT
jgi:hypothetical protein